MAYYIANRLAWAEMNKITPRAQRLNQGMANNLRDIALGLGIKKTQAGQRLEFYHVSEEDYQTLINPATASFVGLKHGVEWRPLLAVDRTLLNAAIDRVNGQYDRRMDRKTYAKYKQHLKTELQACVVKIQDDKAIARKNPTALAANPFKAGDLILHRWHYSAPDEIKQRRVSDTRVVRATKAYVWLEYLTPREGHHNTSHGLKLWSNQESAEVVFNDVATYGEVGYHNEHGFFIPLAGNEDKLEWQPLVRYGGQVVRHRWDKVRGQVDNTAEPGYVYEHQPRWD